MSGEQALGKVPQRVGRLLVELADDAEVDIADRVVREHDEVGRMRIGVKVAEPVDLVQRVPHDVAGDAPRVVAARRKVGQEARVRCGAR